MNSNMTRALALLVSANRDRLAGWSALYKATSDAVDMDGVTVGTLAKATADDDGAWRQAGFAKVSEETLRSYLTAWSVIRPVSADVALSPVVAGGNVHKAIATAKASGVPTAKVTGWVGGTAKALQAAPSDGRAKVLSDAVEALREAGKAAKAAKAATESGPAKGSDETDATDATVEAATTPDTIEALIRAAMGPIGKAAKVLTDTGACSADDAAAIRMLGQTVAVMIRTLDAVEARTA